MDVRDAAREARIKEEGGVYIEERPVAPGMVRSVSVVGHHDGRCERGENGWMCSDACQLREAHVSMNPLIARREDHAGFSAKIERRGLRVRWELRRLVDVRTYRNGRSHARDAIREVQEIASGWALTKRGARRRVDRLEIDDAVNQMQSDEDRRRRS